MANDFRLRIARWPKDMTPLREVRTEVFIEEQDVSPAEEWDGLDDQSLHILALDDHDTPIGTGRLLPEGKIGRMAVLKPWRGKGIGSAILEMLMREARSRGHHTVKLAAQVHAIPFYEKFGFKAYGEEFMDAGIPHFWMEAELDEPAGAGEEHG